MSKYCDLKKYLLHVIQKLVRLCAGHHIKPHVPPFVYIPVNSFEF